jgi:hypothetical protein
MRLPSLYARFRALHGVHCIDQTKGVQFAVELLDALKDGACYIDRRHLPAAIHREQLVGGKAAKFLHHSAYPFLL